MFRKYINNSEERLENNSDGANVPNKNQKEPIQRRGGNGPKKKEVDDDNNNSTTHNKVVDVNMVDDAAEKNKVEGFRLLDIWVYLQN